MATVSTKILVPVLYVIFVLDLKILKWEDKRPAGMDEVPPDGKGDGTPAPAAALPAPSSPASWGGAFRRKIIRLHRQKTLHRIIVIS